MPFLLSGTASLSHPSTHTVHLTSCVQTIMCHMQHPSALLAAQYGKLQLIVNPRATRRENCLSLVQHGFKLAAHLVDVLAGLVSMSCER